MCRNIRTLFNFEPPATEDEIRASALQFVRKLSGYTHPSKTNEAAFERAVGSRRRAHREIAKSKRRKRGRKHESASPDLNISCAVDGAQFMATSPRACGRSFRPECPWRHNER